MDVAPEKGRTLTSKSCMSQQLENNDYSLLRLCSLCIDVKLVAHSADMQMCPTIVISIYKLYRLNREDSLFSNYWDILR